MVSAIANAVDDGFGGGSLGHYISLVEQDIEESKKRFILVDFGSLSVDDKFTFGPVERPRYKKISTLRAQDVDNSMAKSAVMKPGDSVVVFRLPLEGESVLPEKYVAEYRAAEADRIAEQRASDKADNDVAAQAGLSMALGTLL